MAMDGELKYFIGVITACFMTAAGTVTFGLLEGQAKTHLDETMSTTLDNVTYKLTGPHTITTVYGQSEFDFNYDNKSVVAKQFRHIGFGGAGAGGMQPFHEMEKDDPGVVERTRVQGCQIGRNQAVTLSLDGWFKSEEYKAAKENAAAFVAKYCPV